MVKMIYRARYTFLHLKTAGRPVLMGQAFCVVKHIFATMGCFVAARPSILHIYYHNSMTKYPINIFSGKINETDLRMTCANMADITSIRPYSNKTVVSFPALIFVLRSIYLFCVRIISGHHFSGEIQPFIA